MVIDPSLHHHLLRIASLRPSLAVHGLPSAELMHGLAALTRPGQKSLEIGFSLLSLQMMQTVEAHQAVLPGEHVETELLAFCAGNRIDMGRFKPVIGSLPGCLMTLPAAEFHHIVLSAPFGFPLFFAAAEEAFRLLRIGGRLTVRGAGPWTVEQLKNFLRVDPCWNGYQLIAPDAVSVVKAAATENVDWRQQPYITANSAIFDPGTIEDQRRKPLYTRIANFSTEGARLAEAKAKQPELRQLGLVGYYGFGNYGDELFRLAFETQLPQAALQMLHDVPRRPYYLEDKKKKIEQVDGVIVGGGDLLIPGYWTDFYFEQEFLAKPVFVHGIGVPRWTGGEAGVLKRLRDFLQHPNVRYINVRDEESRAWVTQHMRPNIEVTMSADIVCGIELPPALKEPRTKRIFGLITREQKATESDYVNLRQCIERGRALGYHVRQIIAGTGLVGEEDYAAALAYPLPVDELIRVETIEEINAAILDCDVIASMKFHGCVVGVMAGLPTVGLLTTDKFVNFYRMLDAAHLVTHFRSEQVAHVLDTPLQPVKNERLEQLRADARNGMAKLREALARYLK